jgi:hypothetical protein
LALGLKARIRPGHARKIAKERFSYLLRPQLARSGKALHEVNIGRQFQVIPGKSRMISCHYLWIPGFIAESSSGRTRWRCLEMTGAAAFTPAPARYGR